jgi:glutaredoxin
VTLTIYSRPGCHLCEDMKVLVTRTVRHQSPPIAVEEIDISTDPELEARYGSEIPVLMIDGKKVAKYRIRESELLRVLAGRAG